MFNARLRAFCQDFLARWGAGGELPEADAADTPRWYDRPFWC